MVINGVVVSGNVRSAVKCVVIVSLSIMIRFEDGTFVCFFRSLDSNFVRLEKKCRLFFVAVCRVGFLFFLSRIWVHNLSMVNNVTGHPCA